MKKLFFLSLLSLVLINSSCNFLAETLWYDFGYFENNTDDSLTIYTNTYYPDTILPQYNNASHDVCPPHQRVTIETDNSRRAMFKKNRIIQLFVYKTHDITTYMISHYPPIDSMYNFRFQHLELRRYELTREWLEEHDWTVVYP